ncbi:MAG: glycosyltransferase [Zoogloeaceae bacterium]|jgi:cellulose synthase/poly-beta-1,6-N-acetylglucosamine synthase-like glycosyltransferase|nr:glycosyltransferase [Zoogloeaceae bacterium]
MMMEIIMALFWFCLFLPFYAWIGYPLSLAALCLFVGRRKTPEVAPEPVSIIIAAYNEAGHIEQTLRDLLAQPYPADREIILASDGSDDDTVARARAIAATAPCVKVLDLPRQGKAAALNAAARVAQYGLLVFTDADNRWQDDILARLLAPFADPEVGCCAGNVQIPRAGHALSLGDQLYRHYETWLREAENRVGCVASADGALLALRRELFQEVPGEVTDDFFLSTCAPMAGKRIIYVRQARVFERGVDAAARQFHRRVRVTVGGLQSLTVRRGLMNPLRHGFYAIALISHKLLRRLAPTLLLPLLVCNLLLWETGYFYRFTLIAQLLAYAVGLVGLLDHQGRLPKPFRLAGFLLVTLAGMSVGLLQFLCGRRYGLWVPQRNR